MLITNRFEPTHSTFALDVIAKHRRIINPAGGIIRVIAGPKGEGDRVVDVGWGPSS